MKKIVLISLVFVASLTVISLLVTHNKTNETSIYSAVIHQSEQSYWYYEILLEGELLIRQEVIPGISGVHRFQTEEDALRVARLVVSKMEQGVVPRVTADEIEELNITFGL